MRNPAPSRHPQSTAHDSGCDGELMGKRKPSIARRREFDPASRSVIDL
jgi:hypothetical protein